uniref:Transport protein, putative n=2 Tax=Saccharolobus solfataricus TaxID=2287 RepID=D0KSM9_SACS9
MTSYAVDNAVKTNNLVLGLTTAGWSIGWILSYIAYTTIHNWNQICIISSIIIVSIAFLDRRVSLERVGRVVGMPPSMGIPLLEC